MAIFTIQGHPEVQSKMAAVGHHEFVTFDTISLESYVIPHFRLILAHWYTLVIFTIQGHPEVKKNKCH